MPSFVPDYPICYYMLLSDFFVLQSGVQVVLQSVTAFFVLQSAASLVTKLDRYYKFGKFLLQSGSGITKRGNFY